ncbi:hypothetical protein TB2_028436 [Malus domestica]
MQRSRYCKLLSCTFLRLRLDISFKDSRTSKQDITREALLRDNDSPKAQLTFKKKASNAIKEIWKFAQKAMGTTDVRVDVKLNKLIWSHGIRSVPMRVRMRIARQRNEEEDGKEELYSLVTVTEVPP